MVLDSKQMEWASQQGLDTATLKKAKVPIFGKWYFPDLPANAPMVNFSTGQTEKFPVGYRAGAVLYVKDEDLRRAGIGPYKGMAAPAPSLAAEVAAPAAVAVAAAPARPAPAPRAAAPAPAVHYAPAPAHHAPAPGGGHAAAHGDAHAHPTPKTYVMIALILCIVTAIEVWVYYVPALLPFIFPILLVLSVFKFVLVVGWFMHLKFDHSSFTWYFAGGLGLAIAIFSGLVLLQIATHGMPPGDGNAHVFPPNLAPASAPAQPAGH